MVSNRQIERRRIIAPTQEAINESRKRIQAIIKEASVRHHPFTREDFEAFAESSLGPIDNKKLNKESAKTSE
jgi:hypothetical protein